MSLNTTTRRVFLLQVAATGSLASAAALAATTLPAGAATVVNEKDASAAVLGYVSDNSRVDKKKFPQFGADQKCGNCAIFQGKAGASTGPCPIFAGKLVTSAGWCASWTKKA